MNMSFFLRVAVAVIHVAVMSTDAPGQEQKSAVTDSLIEHYSINTGISTGVNSRHFIEFVELTESQLERIQEIKKEYAAKAKEIRRSRLMLNEKKFSQLQSIRLSQETAITKVLLKHQKKLAISYGTYLYVSREGLANSIANGTLRKILKLTPEELRAFKLTTKSVEDEYESEVAKLQKKSIQKMLDSLPEKKRTRLEEIIADLFRPDGSLFPANRRLFKVLDSKH